MTTGKTTIGFLYLGGAHQILHTAPVAAELARAKAFDVICFVTDDEDEEILRRVFTAYPGAELRLEHLPAPGWGRLLARFQPRLAALKLPRLLANAGQLRRCAALVTAERTSTILKRLRLFNRPLIHIPHGAGDRAKGFEKRLRLFDLIIAAGEKDAERMIAEVPVAPESMAVGGAIKLGAVAAMAAGAPRLFDNDRPIVVYNPHFDGGLGSWPEWGRKVIAWFTGQTDYNLVVAPHVRLRESLTPAEQAAIKALEVPGSILIDLGSAWSCDMTYTNAANIYLGDVSSQVYEFVSRPRPCIFLNAHHVTWRNDPNYACWHFGDVIDAPDDLATALAHAAVRHGAGYRDVQASAVEKALGHDWTAAPARVAEIISRYVEKKSGQDG